jgi:hypothetical protein
MTNHRSRNRGVVMKEKEIARLVRRLADEPAIDRQDPWPEIRARVRQDRWQPRGTMMSVRRLSRAALGFAVAVLVLTVGGAAIYEAARPPSATAGEMLTRMQVEAQDGMSMAGPMDLACEPVGPNPTEVTDRVGQILGVSGDRVRQAMRIQMVRGPSGAPGAPGGASLPDPMGNLARELGVNREQLHQAFADPACPERVMIPFPGSQSAQYQRAAQRLGVSPERLAQAVRATAPLGPPGLERAPLSPDEMITRIASELGVTPEQFRSALQQAGGGSGARGGDFLLPR